jgi:VWFA-related protein
VLEAGSGRKQAASCALLLVAALVTLPTPARTGQDQPPVFPSDVALVTVDAVVVDAHGQPVCGLTRDDFTVLEGGVVQQTAAFEEVVPSTSRESSSTTLSAAPPPPRVVSNLDPQMGGASFLVVADDIHLSSRGAVEARSVLATFLREFVREGDRLAVVFTRTGAAWSGTLMDDQYDLLAFVAKLKSRSRDTGPQLMTELEALRVAEYNDRETLERVEGRYWLQKRCYEGPRDCSRLVHTDAEAFHAQARLERAASLAAVEAAVDTFGRRRGRKTVLLLSEGFPHDAREEGSRRVVRAAERVNAAVYFVDVRGVVALPPWVSADAPNDAELNPSRMTSEQVLQIKDMMARASRDRLKTEQYVGVETMAGDTGGLAIRGTNDLASGLARISAESRSYYLLGYLPTSAARDGRFRRIEVRVARPGLTVRARKGYEATGPAGRAPTARDAAADVPLRLATYTLEPVAGAKARVLVALEVDVAGLLPEERGGRRAGRLELRVETTPRDGGEGWVESLTLESPSSPDETRSARGQWHTVRVEFELEAGWHQVRVSAREPSSGRVGVVAQRVQVPEPGGFRLSTPILSDTVPASSRETGDPQPQALAHRSFRGGSGQPLFCAFEVIGAASATDSGRSHVFIGFELENAAGNVVATLPPTALAPAVDGRLQAVLALPLAELPSGDYALQLRAEDRVALKTELLREGFAVQRAATAQPSEDTRAGTTPEAAHVPEELRPILERAGRYVLQYERAFSHVFAEESYRQDYTDPTGQRYVRTSRADVVFVSLPGPVPWTVFRDVIEVDGNAVGDRAARMKRLFVESPGTAVEKARRILDESGRYNLGPLRRTVNFPTLALAFLLPDVQGRFAFEGRGRQSVGGMDRVEVAFVEHATPTIVHDDSGHDVPSRGRLWIDPDTGQVVRSVLEHDANGHSWLAWARIAVEYRREPRLDILVPDSMTETYGTPESQTPQADARAGFDPLGRPLSLHLVTTARYSAYGHFEVETQESFRTTEPESP